MCKVNQVYFMSSARTGKIIFGISDTKQLTGVTFSDQFLLSLSLHVQSISIVLGRVDIDWPTILVGMFSRKLDKMKIRCNDYLPSITVNALIKVRKC